MNNYGRGKQLLEFLGTPVQRPKPAPVQSEASNGTCRECFAVIVWATAPSGKRIPLDVHPEGNWVIVAGNAVAFGPAHEGARRYAWHFASCREKGAQS